MEALQVYSAVFDDTTEALAKAGFSPVRPEGLERGALPLFPRQTGGFFEYAGAEGKVRLLFSDTKVVLLSGSPEAASEDDSDYEPVASFLFEPADYTDRDVKSLCGSIREEIDDAFTPKQIARRQQNVKAQATVSRSQVKSGALLYDSTTLAIRLAAIYPELKDLYKAHVEYYDEFLCDDFFITNVNPRVYDTIRSGNQTQLKKLFNILNDIYEDGSNEVQDVIVVTMLASFNYTDEEYNRVLGLVSDTMMETFIRVRSYLMKSKSARMRLENPPKYKPRKEKRKGGLLQTLMGGGQGGLQQ